MKKEVQLCSKASHEKVVRVLGTVPISSSIGIVMEYLKYGNLKVVVGAIGNDMPTCILQRMMLNVAEGLAYLHNLHKDTRIVHGDIKPENILVGDHLVCKISDFGGSVLRERTGLTPQDAGHDSISVTKKYCAPELLKNPKQKARTSMDVFSFGKVVENSNVNGVEKLVDISQRACNKEHSKRPSMLDVYTELDTLNKIPNKTYLESLALVIGKLEENPIVDLSSVSNKDKLNLMQCLEKDFESRAVENFTKTEMVSEK